MIADDITWYSHATMRIFPSVLDYGCLFSFVILVVGLTYKYVSVGKSPPCVQKVPLILASFSSKVNSEY